MKALDRGGGTGPFRSLLVAVDLTPISDRVVGRVARLPLAEDARVTLLHVIPDGLTPTEQHIAERDANKALAEEARHLSERLSPEIRVETSVRSGGAAKEIAAAAAQAQAELIVLGRGGGRALRDMFLGSTAERVVRQARLPVLVIRLPARSAYSRPALAVDLDPIAHEVVRVMVRVLPPPRPVDVIHAYCPRHVSVYPSLPDFEAERRQLALRAEATRELQELLAEASAKVGLPATSHPTWRTLIQLGPPRRVVERATKRADTDLLVLGTRASTAAYVFLGTVGGDLLRAATCDVLMVPPPPPD